MNRIAITTGVLLSLIFSGVTVAEGTYSQGNDNESYYVGFDLVPTFYVSHVDGHSKINPSSTSYRTHAGVKSGTYTLEGSFWFNNNNEWGGAGTGVTLMFGNAYYNFPLSKDLIVALGGGLGWLHGLDTTVASGSDNHMAYQGIVGMDYSIKPDLSVDTSYHLIKWTKSDGDYAHAVNFGLSYHF